MEDNNNKDAKGLFEILKMNNKEICPKCGAPKNKKVEVIGVRGDKETALICQEC